MRCPSSISDFSLRRPSNYVFSPWIQTHRIYTICLLLKNSYHILFALEFQRDWIQYWFISINSTSIPFENVFELHFGYLVFVFTYQQINFLIIYLIIIICSIRFSSVCKNPSFVQRSEKFSHYINFVTHFLEFFEWAKRCLQRREKVSPPSRKVVVPEIVTSYNNADFEIKIVIPFYR